MYRVPVEGADQKIQRRERENENVEKRKRVALPSNGQGASARVSLRQEPPSKCCEACEAQRHCPSSSESTRLPKGGASLLLLRGLK